MITAIIVDDERPAIGNLAMLFKMCGAEVVVESLNLYTSHIEKLMESVNNWMVRVYSRGQLTIEMLLFS